MPFPVSHESRNRGKLPLSCWLRNTAPVFADAVAIAWLKRVTASSHVVAFHAAPSLYIGVRKRSGLYSPCNAAWPRAHKPPRLSGCSGLPSSLIARPSRVSDMIPHVAEHSRHVVA